MNNATKAAHQAGCSCGCTETHVVARRKTFDNVSVQIWSDGAVTCGLNTYVAMAPRSAWGRGKAVEAAWLVADRVSLYDHSELRGLVLKARAAVAQTGHRPGDHLDATLRGVKFVRAGRHGAVVRHAPDCGCGTCAGRRAANLAMPRASRLYGEPITLANGFAFSPRIR